MNHPDEKKELKNVSVVMCTYNGELYLKEQLDSILSQTYPLFEIIIRDDCSTDNTWAILQDYQSKNPTLLKCSQNNHNVGYWMNFKLGMLQAKGDYIAFSDQDDIWMSDKIEELLFTIGEKMLAVSNSKILNELTVEDRTLFQEHNLPNMTIEKLIWDNHIFGHSCMINVALLDYINRIKITTAHDYLIALVCFSLNSVAMTDKELQVWRRHSQSLTGSSQFAIKNVKKKRIKGYRKTIYAIFCLILGRKSEVIHNGFLRINLILSQLKEEKSVTQNIDDLILITSLMKNQSLLSYIRASFICWKLKETMFDYKSKDLRNDLLTVTFVFRWWYDHRFDMA